MSEEKNYKGKKIVIKTDSTGSKLYVDGTFIETTLDSSGKYWSNRIPYASFSSLMDLGRTLIDKLS
ncbi:MAG: hypothetical protein HYS80_01455 [Candidatus Aenigmarchaeota archaeon]|nr:hypothetical protein [Candidatus Aenigmarchaeota archaeon]